jgi:PEP-CTERM motif-containing protein
MNISKIAAVAALALAGGLAHAGPTNIGDADGIGTFDFSGTKDSAFYVVLGPGQYSFSSDVTSQGEDLNGVWLSYTHNKKQGGKGDFYDFTENSPTSFSGFYSTLTLTEETKIYVDVDTLLGKHHKGASFDGSLTVSAVPEPASVALLLAGLGMMGFVARRRKN